MALGEFGYCCEMCQIYWTCETKWYRGEKGEEHICCEVCDYYITCSRSAKKDERHKKQ